jgi:hypothetical protein
MLNEAISFTNNLNLHTAKHSGNIEIKSSLSSYLLGLRRADNVCKHFPAGRDKLFFQATTDWSAENETAEEKEQADYLFQCVSELKNNPDCLLQAKDTKFTRIHIAEETYIISTVRVELPSGNAIYAGFLDDRLIVSHGEIYHIEAMIRPNITFLGSMGNLLAHFIGGHQWEYSTPNQPAWMDRLFAWFAGLRDPLMFPGAEGQMTATAGMRPLQNILYRSATEFQAQLKVINITEPEAGIISPHLHVSAITNPLAPAKDIAEILPGRGRIMFDIGGHQLELNPANKIAAALLAQLDSTLSLENTPQDELSYLLKLDMLIAGKTAEIIYNGLLFKDKSYSLNMIILKSYTENIITKFNDLLYDKLEPHIKISSHLNSYSAITDHIPDINKKIADAYEHVNIDVIVETISSLKNKNFALAETAIIEKLHNASFNEHAHLHNILRNLYLLKESHEEFSKQLVLDEISPFDKMSHVNTLDIYFALMTGDRDFLIDALIKLKFYHILEYTRLNGISIHSHNFLLPGEMTDHWYLFSEDEHEIDFSTMKQVFSTELHNYIYRKDDNHPYLDLIMNLVEVFRLNEKQHDADQAWYKKNLFPWQKTLQIVKELIENNTYEKEKFTHHTLWREDFRTLIRHDKTVFVLMTFCINAQQEFVQMIRYYFDQDIILQADSEEQFIAAAKVEAMKLDADFADKKINAYGLLEEYERRLESGDFDLMIRAAVFWFFSRFSRHDDEHLSSFNIFYVLQKFINAQQYLFIKYKSRLPHDFTSVFELQASNKKESLEDYYNQFYDYKHQYSFHEARYMAMQALASSTVDYIDAIYPPKEIFAFMVFSRNYISNSLSPFNHYSMPEKNPGFLTIARLYSGKLILLSTLAGFVFISDINQQENDPLIRELKDHWLQSDETIDVSSRAAYSVNETVMAHLFPPIDANSAQLTTLLDIVLKAPEEDSVTLPRAPYTLLAIKGQDIMKVVKPYLFSLDDRQQALHPDAPFIKYIDFLTQATLITLSDRLKEVLRYYSWVDFISSTIPFFEALCRNWHDKDHTISFKDIMFDLFDLMLLIVQLGGNFKKISENTLKHALHNALKNDIKQAALKQFMIRELIAQSSQAGMDMSKIATKEFLSFLCPLQPSSSSVISITEKLHHKVQESILVANVAIRAERLRKKLLRQSWKVNVDTHTLETQAIGIYADKTSERTNYYVVNDHDYFPVFRESDSDVWRIANHHMPNERAFAVPIARSPSGEWITSISKLPAPLAPSFDRYHPSSRKITELGLIKPEPMCVLAEPDAIDKGTINFHKRILRFYLYNNKFVHDLLLNKAHREHFLMRFNRTFFFRNEIIAAIKTNGYSRDESFIVSASRALDERQEGIMRFRAVSAWRNQFDTSPEGYFALRIDIGKNKFIIDIKEMRKTIMTLDNRDVFTENEWLMMYKRSPQAFELIKYKDFDFMEDAEYFSYREATSPSVIIKNGFLLKEPAWYKPSLLSNNRSHKQKTYTLVHDGVNEIRYAARALRRDSRHFSLPEQFPLDVLLKCNKIDEESARQLLRMVMDAKKSNLHSQAFFINKERLSSTESLLKVNDGILLGIYNTSGCLEHLLLSIKHGRFIGMRNSFFDPALPERASIVIAEQLGTFHGGFLRLRHKEQNFFVIVGEAHGSSVSTAVYSDIPHEKITTYLSDGRIKGYREQAIPRKNLLLGKDCHIELLNDVKTRLRIKLHGAPFNVNHMDAIEFSDIIKGLQFLEDTPFILHQLESIDLYSCYGGFGYRYSTAQTLADELGIKIKTYPYKVIDGGRMEERRPQWFRWFTPDVRLWGPTSGPGPSRQNVPNFNAKEYKRTQNIHRRLHDLIDFVLRMNQKFFLSRERRDEISKKAESDSFNTSLPLTAASEAWQAPLIYFDIFQLLYNKRPDLPHAVGDIQLSPTSLQVLEQIVADYDLEDDQESIFAQQAFLDILLSIEEFKYLSDWFNLDTEYHEESLTPIPTP